MQAPLPTPQELPDLSALNLPDEDGIPLENFLHWHQQGILLDSLTQH